MNTKAYIIDVLDNLWTFVDREVIEQSLETPKDKKMGDLAFPCFRLAKTLHKAPNMIAADLKELLEGQKLFEKVEVVGPYVNLTIDKAWMAEFVLDQVDSCAEEGKVFGTSDEGQGKTVILDYSSINVAKPFHIGHLRTTVIGNSLKRIHQFMGYNTYCINYLGDWGTQFGKMLVAYRKWGDPSLVEKDGIRYLVSLYVRFHSEAEKNEALNDEARAAFTSLEKGDQDALALWQHFIDVSLKDVMKVYELLDVQFDSYQGESYFWDKTDELLRLLDDKKLLSDSEGAKIVDLSDFNMPPCLILKKDGSTLYATRDISSAMYRKKTFDFYKNIYITGLEQILHFNQWFKVCDMMGFEWAQDLVHIPYGLISLEEGKLSTRSGNVIWLEDLLKEAIAKTRSIIEEKNPNLENIDEVAQQVGVGAVVFHDLFNNRIKEITFSWDSVLNFDGETGPYVQYTYARASNVLRKAEWNRGSLEKVDYAALTDEYSQEILKLVEAFPAKVKEALDKYEPYIVTRYAVALAGAFNRFYHENSILNADEADRKARLKLTDVTTRILKQALYLIGVSAPEKM
ncbi:MAG: arginine--tRNA ligase [Lachnospiraceae bacterium]|nr:arginine--tRNA ligase [Lachnospiraceae bacterium]